MIFNFSVPYSAPTSNDLVFAFGDQGSFTAEITLLATSSIYALAEGFSQFDAQISLSINGALYGFSNDQLQLPITLDFSVEFNSEFNPIEGLVGYMEITF